MNDCDMELITLEEMELTDNLDKASYLIPETNVDDDALCIHAHTHSGSATAPSK